MIIEYNESGRVTHVMGTYPGGAVDALAASGRRFLVLKERPAFAALIDGYVLDGKLLQRPVMEAELSKSEIIADGVDEAVISGLPDPCIVYVGTDRYDVVGGSLEITADVPTTYQVTVQAWPFTDCVLSIEAVVP